MLSCTVTKPVKTGEMAFQVKQFEWAIELLVKEIERLNGILNEYIIENENLIITN